MGVVVGGSIVKLCEDTLLSLTPSYKDSEPCVLSVSLLSFFAGLLGTGHVMWTPFSLQ